MLNMAFTVTLQLSERSLQHYNIVLAKLPVLKKFKSDASNVTLVPQKTQSDLLSNGAVNAHALLLSNGLLLFLFHEFIMSCVFMTI